MLSKALPMVIKTEEENDRAIGVVEKLLTKGNKMSAEENALLELLGQLIADFEGKFYTPRQAEPREVLSELMAARGLIQKDLVEIFGSKSRASEALKGKREISKAQAKTLARFFNVSAELFL